MDIGHAAKISLRYRIGMPQNIGSVPKI